MASSWSCEKAGCRWIWLGYGCREGGAQGDGTVVCPVDLRRIPPAVMMTTAGRRWCATGRRRPPAGWLSSRLLDTRGREA